LKINRIIPFCNLFMGRPSYIFSPEKLATFFVHHCRFYHFTRSLECRPLFPACCYVAKNFCRSSCGDPLLWGPLFGRTCWTCLNPAADHASLFSTCSAYTI